MKPEEAIKILQGRIELTKKVCSNVPEIIEYREALELAVKALQVQISMKPDNTCNKHTKKTGRLFNGEIHPKINAVRAEMSLSDGKVDK